MVDIGSAVGYLLLDNTGFATTLQRSMQELRVFGDSSATVSDKLKGLGSACVSVGANLTKSLTLPTLAVGAGAMLMASNYQTSLAKISTIVDTTTTSMDELSAGTLGLSRRTGMAASELNAAMYEAISSGVAVGDALKFTEVAAKAAVGGFTDTATAVDGLTSVMNTYGIKTGDAEALANKFMVTQNLGKTTFGEIAGKIGLVAPVANAAGVSVDELLSSIAALTANGVQTSEAVTGVKAALSNVIKPTKEANDMAASLGLNFSLSALKAKGFAGFLEDVKSKTGGSTEKMAQLFGSVEALNSVLTLTSAQGSTLVNQSLTEMKTNTTGLNDAVTKMNDTSARKFAITLESVKSLGIEIGMKLLPIFDRMLNEFILPIVDWLTNLSAAQMDFVIKIGMLAAAIGPVLMIAGSAFTLISNVAGAMTLLKTANMSATVAQYGFNAALLANPITWIVVGIAALIAAFVLLWQNCDGFRNFFIGMWAGITSAASASWEGIKAGFNAIGAFFTVTIPAMWVNIKQAFVNGWNAIVTFFTISIPAWIVSFGKFLMELPDKIAYALGFAIGAFARWIVDLGKWAAVEIPKFISAVLKFFWELPGKTFDALVGVINSWMKFKSDLDKKAIETGTSMLNTVTKFFWELPGKIGAALNSGYENVKAWGTNLLTWAGTEIPKVTKSVGDFFWELPGQMLEIGKNIVEGLWNGITGASKWLGDKIDKFVAGIKARFTGKNALDIQSPSVVMTMYGGYIAEGLAKGIEENKEKPLSAIDNMVQAIKSTMSTMLGSLSLAVDQSKANFDLWANTIGLTATENETLEKKLMMLSSEMFVQNDRVKTLTLAYQDMVKAKGEASEESRRLFLELTKERIAESDLANQIAQTNKVRAQKSQSFTPEALGITNYLAELKTATNLAGYLGQSGYTQAQQQEYIDSYMASGGMNPKVTEYSSYNGPIGPVIPKSDKTTESVSASKGDVYNFYSPKALTPTETARANKKAQQELAF